ncbi:chromate transporter [Planctomycetales bacterium]|nr:chromate transporter [Planctomycetales bacterium]GHS98985.1 chromate transporter [Planctomycetales bacterium]GHT06970.1 chromate transporter [Planctomycetales bacterium]
MSLWTLYWTFCAIGAMTFGGGYAMLPLFQHILVAEYGLLSPADFANMAAISQLTPGAIGVNTATYIGYSQHGVAGAFAGTAGLLTPPFFIALGVARIWGKFRRSPAVAAILKGVAPAMFGLIATALVFFGENSLLKRPADENAAFNLSSLIAAVDAGNVLIFAVVLLLAWRTKLSVPVLLGGSAAAGVAMHW